MLTSFVGLLLGLTIVVYGAKSQTTDSQKVYWETIYVLKRGNSSKNVAVYNHTIAAPSTDQEVKAM